MSTAKKYDRIIIFGDIHGCLDELKISLEKLKYDNSKDRLIFVGDLVDRGPFSSETVKFIRKGNYECVCGNHDDKHIRYHKHNLLKKENPNYKNPINLSEDKRNIFNNLNDEDLNWLTKLPKKIFIEEQNLLVIHGGVLPHMHPLYQPDNVYLYCRHIHKETYKMLKMGPDLKPPQNSIFWSNAYNGKFNIIYGHQVHHLKNPFITTNKLGIKTFGIDTGCVFGGHLTCMIIENNEHRFFGIEAKEKYYRK